MLAGLKLYTFLISHFSEKARWALDLNGLAFDERRLLPGAHMPSIRWRAKGTSVPVLAHEGDVIQGSGAILDFLEQRLGAQRLAPPSGSAARCKEIEELADRAFGRGTQRIFYASLLRERDRLVELWTQGGPAWGKTFYALTLPLLAKGLTRAYKIRPDKIEEAKELFRRTFDELDRAIDGRPYLLGDAISRADVTVAALLAPTVQPPEHPLRWPSTMPADLEAFVRELRGRPTWEFVLRMYREHRPRPG